MVSLVPVRVTCILMMPVSPLDLSGIEYFFISRVSAAPFMLVIAFFFILRLLSLPSYSCFTSFTNRSDVGLGVVIIGIFLFRIDVTYFSCLVELPGPVNKQ